MFDKKKLKLEMCKKKITKHEQTKGKQMCIMLKSNQGNQSSNGNLVI